MISYAQNLEDVMLARVFRGQEKGFYIDVGAQDPVTHSVTQHFYNLGWSGVNIEPVAQYHARLMEVRPRDINLKVALGEREEEGRRFFEVADTGLSTLVADFADIGRAVETRVAVTTLVHVCEQYAANQRIDFLKVDVEGWEGQVLAGADWARFRPVVVVVEATRPNSAEPSWVDWEPMLLDAGYRFTWFDGLNRFYVRREDEHLVACFETPPNVFDGYVSHEIEVLRGDQEKLLAEIDRLRSELAALQGAARQMEGEYADLQARYSSLEGQFAEGPLAQHKLPGYGRIDR